jgi:hypothetical protein
MLAIMALMAVPATADLSPSTLTPSLNTGLQSTGQGTVGIYATGGGIYLDYKTYAEASDLIHLTFAFHWPYVTNVYGVQAQFSFVWDNSEVEVLGMLPAGGFGPSNFSAISATWWMGPSSGTLQVGDVLGTGVPLWTNPVGSTYTTYYGGQITPGDTRIQLTHMQVVGSGIYPFMQVDLHVKDYMVPADSFLDAFVGSFALLFLVTPFSPGTWWTGGAIGAPSYGMGVIPEPASLTLLGLGLASIGAGVWRRRR